MKHTARLVLLGSVLAAIAALSPAARAGGLALYEIASPDVGLASAGYAARAQDASTLFKNPAGMSLLQGAQLQSGLQLTYGDVKFSPDAGTGPLLGTDNGGNAVGALPAASLFITVPLTEQLTVGFGTFSYFGLVESYSPGWVGRYYIQDGATLGMSFMPSVSFKATEWLSVGAGLNAMFGYMDTKMAIRTGAPGDGQLEMNDSTWGFGANVGVLITPCAGTRIGLDYLSPVKLDFGTTPSFSNLGPLGALPIFTTPPKLDVGMTVPQSVMLSVFHELNSKWALMGDVGWQNWSQFGKVDVGVDSANPTSLTTSLNYEDTWHAAVGAQYRASETWVLSTGFAYDSSAVSDANRTLAMPMGEAYRLGLGAQWQISQKVNLGAAYEFLWAGDMSVVQNSAYRGNVSGSYKDSWFSFLTVNLTWQF